VRREGARLRVESERLINLSDSHVKRADVMEKQDAKLTRPPTWDSRDLKWKGRGWGFSRLTIVASKATVVGSDIVCASFQILWTKSAHLKFSPLRNLVTEALSLRSRRTSCEPPLTT
jgi:hypothetical protein